MLLQPEYKAKVSKERRITAEQKCRTFYSLGPHAFFSAAEARHSTAKERCIHPDAEWRVEVAPDITFVAISSFVECEHDFHRAKYVRFCYDSDSGMRCAINIRVWSFHSNKLFGSLCLKWHLGVLLKIMLVWVEPWFPSLIPFQCSIFAVVLGRHYRHSKIGPKYVHNCFTYMRVPVELNVTLMLSISIMNKNSNRTKQA